MILKYECLNNEPKEQIYEISQKLKMDDYHYSETCENATRIFSFVYYTRIILECMNNGRRNSVILTNNNMPETCSI
jgi:hypothetical protein